MLSNEINHFNYAKTVGTQVMKIKFVISKLSYVTVESFNIMLNSRQFKITNRMSQTYNHCVITPKILLD